MSLGGAYTLLPWLAVGADLPFVVHQSRQRDVPGVQGGLSSLGTAGLEDLRLTVKVGLLRAERHRIDLALLLQGTVPTWTDHDYFVENTASFTPGLALSRALTRGLRLAANASYRLRRNARLLDLRVGDELEFKTGAGWRFAERGGPPLEFDAVLYAATAAAAPFQHENRDAVEALGMASFGGVSIFAGGGSDLRRGFGAPDWRAFLGARLMGAPAGDRDHDGFKDDRDRCPSDPEDRDGFQDDDGCPDLDNDADEGRQKNCRVEFHIDRE